MDLYCCGLVLESYYPDIVGRDSSVGIATGFGSDGPGIESVFVVLKLMNNNAVSTEQEKVDLWF
jgi:hypothetical protein